jgi:hypothetical protein
MTQPTTEYAWQAQAGPQLEAILEAYRVDELFFGGARGGGKTDLLLGDFAMDVDLGAAWQGVIFRKTYDELDEIKQRAEELYMNMGAVYQVQPRTWRWPSGATLKLRYLETIHDAKRYQGHSYTWVGFDELTNWPDAGIYHKLKATARSAHGVPGIRVRSTGNPGGVGDHWVKEYFRINEHPDAYDRYRDPETGLCRMFIPSRVEYNTILIENDPGYIGRIKSAAHGDEQLLKAWLYGDFSAIIGQYFGQWNRNEVEVEPFPIPQHWMLFGSLDYGEANPTSFGLSAVDYDDVIYRVGEYYLAGATAAEHARNIKAMIKGCPWTNGRAPAVIYADPSMWVKRRLTEATAKSAAQIFAEEEVFGLKAANNDRINGWRICKDALNKKMFKVFKGGCPDFVRTVPALPRDERKPEDVDTTAEDHGADDWRYGMVHMFKPRKVVPRQAQGTGEEIMQHLRRQWEDDE